jgi:hypothetical protein
MAPSYPHRQVAAPAALQLRRMERLAVDRCRPPELPIGKPEARVGFVHLAVQLVAAVGRGTPEMLRRIGAGRVFERGYNVPAIEP